MTKLKDKISLFFLALSIINGFSQEKIKVFGHVTNIFYEAVDSVMITIKDIETNNNISSCYTDQNGYFDFEIDSYYYNKNIILSCYKIDYHPYEVNIKIDFSIKNLSITLNPRYKILLKGRIYINSTPLENVSVEIIHDTNNYKLTTLGCYYDDENYWNCLYYGMFKIDLITDNPENPVKIICNKKGYKPIYYEFKFSEYKGDILKFKMKYADTVPDLGKNNIHFKFTNPFTDNSRWFLNFSYYRNINIKNFNRLYFGAEFALNSKTISVIIDGLPQYLNFITYDTAYINYFVGPSVLIFFTRPEKRYFSSYGSVGFLYSSASNNFIVQPSIGTRIILDMQKSLTLEVRYLHYNLKVKNYIFNYYGDATPYYKTIIDKSLIIKAGLQINF